jgi:hypothetical protein
MLNDMLMNVCFLLYIFFICCVCDFMFEFEVWKEVGMSFNCSLSEPGVPARSVVEVFARSALTEGSDRVAFVLIHPEVQLGTEAVQGVRRLRKVLGLQT